MIKRILPNSLYGQIHSTEKFRPVPGLLLNKYFGKKDFTVKHPKRQALTRSFLVKQLKVKPESVKFGDEGELLLDNVARNKMSKAPLDDTSFLTNGGRGEALYEGLEMAYNDVMSGTVEAGGLMEPVRNLARTVGKVVPEPVKKIAAQVRDSGALEVLTGVGAGATVGVGLWMAHSGVKQAVQGVARGDRDQTIKGARHVFLGSESLMTGAVLASKVSSHALVQTAGAVALQVATPFALVHGAIDVTEGISHLRDGIKNKDGLSVLEGVAELGMGVGWAAAAFGATPALVAVSCACLAGKLGVATLKNRREKKAIAASIAEHEQFRASQAKQLVETGAKNISHDPDWSSVEPPTLTPVPTNADGVPQTLFISFEGEK